MASVGSRLVKEKKTKKRRVMENAFAWMNLRAMAMGHEWLYSEGEEAKLGVVLVYIIYSYMCGDLLYIERFHAMREQSAINNSIIIIII